jgi:hypothetical protein
VVEKYVRMWTVIKHDIISFGFLTKTATRYHDEENYTVCPKKVPSIEIYAIVVKHRILCDW